MYEELQRLNLLTSQFLDYAEFQALNEEDRNEIIKEMLNDNPSLWTLLYSHDLIDSSMIPKEILDSKKRCAVLKMSIEEVIDRAIMAQQRRFQLSIPSQIPMMWLYI